jgi:hypothetical protein
MVEICCVENGISEGTFTFRIINYDMYSALHNCLAVYWANAYNIQLHGMNNALSYFQNVPER